MTHFEYLLYFKFKMRKKKEWKKRMEKKNLKNYREKEYNEKLKMLLKKHELLVKNTGYEKEIFNKYAKRCSGNIGQGIAFGEFSSEFEKKIKKMVVTYSIKFYLWQQEFCKDGDMENYLDTAINFNVFCCLVDTILDEGSEEITFDSVIQRIKWSKVRQYFDGTEYKKDVDVLDYLYKEIAEGFSLLKKEDEQFHNEIIENVGMALESEIYVSTHKLTETDPNMTKEISQKLLIDKSTKFVKACFQIAAFSAKDKEKLNKCSDCLATAFWLIDDIADLYEDINNKSKNSILNKYLDETKDIEQAIDKVIDDLEDYVDILAGCLKELKNNVGEELYYFLKYHICNWGVQGVIE